MPRGRKREDLIGKRYGRLLVIGEIEPRNGVRWFRAQCDCGRTTDLNGLSLRHRTRSCGCLRNEATAKRSVTHGDTRGRALTTEYRSWRAMINRCEYEKNENYAFYGGRGIKVCKRWRGSFEAFLEDMGRRPSPQHSLDRHPNLDGNYEPGNVRWATKAEQANNRRPRTRKKR